MHEITIAKHPSIALGTALALLSGYLLQYVLLPNPLVFPAGYIIGLGALILVYSASFYAKIEFEGLGILPNKAAVAIIFWISLIAIFTLFVLRDQLDAPMLARNVKWSHFIVGVLLYCFSASAIFGSYFSGFGFSLLLKNPFLWLRYLTMRVRGELDKDA